MNRLSSLAASCHPLPTAAVTGFAAALGAMAGLEPARVALLAGAVFTGQLSIGWLNDLLDADRDRAGGRTDKPIAAGRISPAVVRAAIATAALLCLVLSLLLGWAAAAASLTVVVMGWWYDLSAKFGAASWLPYLVAFAALPAAAVYTLPEAPAPAWWLVLGGGLLGVAAHFLNVVPDIGNDLATGVRGLPQRLGARRSRTIGLTMLFGASAALLLGAVGWFATACALVVVVMAVLLLAGRGRSRASVRLPFVAALAMVALDLVLLAVSGVSLTG